MLKKHEIDETFFKNLNENSAYVLGWIASDGHIQFIPKKKYSIRLELKDLDILEKIRELMKSTHPITKREDRGTYVFVVNSKELVRQLFDLGLTTDKTFTLTMPNIPKNLNKDFIRGFFDGDGSVYLHTGHKGQKSLNSYICCMNKEFLETIGEILNKDLGLVTKIYQDSKSKLFKLSYGAKESYALYKYMYSNTSNFLERKKQVFDNAIEIKAGIGLMNCKRCNKEIVRTARRTQYCLDCKPIILKENERRRSIKRKLKQQKAKETLDN